MSRVVPLLPVAACAALLAVLAVAALQIGRPDLLVASAPLVVTVVAYLGVGRRGTP